MSDLDEIKDAYLQRSTFLVGEMKKTENLTLRGILQDDWIGATACVDAFGALALDEARFEARLSHSDLEALEVVGQQMLGLEQLLQQSGQLDDAKRNEVVEAFDSHVALYQNATELSIVLARSGLQLSKATLLALLETKNDRWREIVLSGLEVGAHVGVQLATQTWGSGLPIPPEAVAVTFDALLAGGRIIASNRKTTTKLGQMQQEHEDRAAAARLWVVQAELFRWSLQPDRSEAQPNVEVIKSAVTRRYDDVVARVSGATPESPSVS